MEKIIVTVVLLMSINAVQSLPEIGSAPSTPAPSSCNYTVYGDCIGAFGKCRESYEFCDCYGPAIYCYYYVAGCVSSDEHENQMQRCIEQYDCTSQQCNSHTSPVKAPVRAPVRAPVSNTPVKAPVRQPVAAPVKAPVRAPVSTPVKAPVNQPVAPPVTAPNSEPLDNTTCTKDAIFNCYYDAYEPCTNGTLNNYCDCYGPYLYCLYDIQCYTSTEYSETISTCVQGGCSYQQCSNTGGAPVQVPTSSAPVSSATPVQGPVTPVEAPTTDTPNGTPADGVISETPSAPALNWSTWPVLVIVGSVLVGMVGGLAISWVRARIQSANRYERLP